MDVLTPDLQVFYNEGKFAADNQESLPVTFQICKIFYAFCASNQCTTCFNRIKRSIVIPVCTATIQLVTPFSLNFTVSTSQRSMCNCKSQHDDILVLFGFPYLQAHAGILVQWLGDFVLKG